MSSTADWSAQEQPKRVRIEYDFEHDPESKTYSNQEEDPMQYELGFGMYKGKKLHEVMKTQRGRAWLKWYAKQPVDPEFVDANQRMKDRIDACFIIYEEWLQSNPPSKRVHA